MTTDPKTLLLAALLLVTCAYAGYWFRRARQSAAAPGVARVGIGAVTNFFDTLGIGSFATTTTMYRFWRLVADEKIPGTLNVGHTLPVIAQAFIYITIVQVDVRTLLLLTLAAVAGAWLGAAVVSRLPRRQIQRGMGFALLAAAALMTMTALNLIPGGGDALALGGTKLVVGCLLNFTLGALMCLGIGLYAPCMIMISLLGMNPTAAFPIMMGSAAFLMPVGSAQFIRKDKYDLRAALGLTLGGIPAVLLAAFIVRSLPLTYVRWLVVIVVVYAATSLLGASAREAAERENASLLIGDV